MPRIDAIKPDEAEGKAKELLEGIRQKYGLTPNIMRTMANAPAALEAFLGFSSALAGGKLDPLVREQIALCVGQVNNCEYCVSAHSAIGGMLGLNPDVILDSRRGKSSDSKVAAALAFSSLLVEKRGWITDEDFDNIQKAGYDQGEIIEIVATVALNLFSNYFNHVAVTKIDFPKAPALD